MQYKNRTSELLYNQMLMADEHQVSQTALSIMNLIQGLKVSNQLLGLASIFIVLLNLYEMDASDVLGIAHNFVEMGSDDRADKNFKAIKGFMKAEWDIN